MPAVSERDRHDLFVAVQDQFGERHADTLMNLLPPVGWADVATKDDVRQLGARLDGEFHHLRKEIVELESRIGLRFDAVDLRFEAVERSINERFESAGRTMNERFESADRTINERFESADRTMNERFDAVDRRFEHADAVAAERFESFQHKIEGVLHQIRGETHQIRGEAHQIKSEVHQVKGDMHQAMEKHLHALIFGFVAAFTSMTSLGIAAIVLG